MNINESEAIKIAKTWLKDNGQDYPLIDISYVPEKETINESDSELTKESAYWLATFQYGQIGIEPEHLFLIVDPVSGEVEAPRMF